MVQMTCSFEGTLRVERRLSVRRKSSSVCHVVRVENKPWLSDDALCLAEHPRRGPLVQPDGQRGYLGQFWCEAFDQLGQLALLFPAAEREYLCYLLHKQPQDLFVEVRRGHAVLESRLAPLQGFLHSI